LPGQATVAIIKLMRLNKSALGCVLGLIHFIWFAGEVKSTVPDKDIVSSWTGWKSADDLFIRVKEINPAATAFIPLPGITVLSSTGGHQRNGALHYSHEGKDVTGLYSQAEGIFKTQKYALMGRSSYSNANHNHTRWSHIADPGIIGPYWLADSTSGKRQYEEYIVEGSMTIRQSWGSYGLFGSYRAQGGYRVTNPRTSNTVSDFNFGAGVIWLWKRYSSGASAAFGNYSQFAQVQNMPSDRKDMFYLMYGLGMHDHRISGSDSNFSLDYQGHSFNYSLLHIPHHNLSGWFFILQHQNRQTQTKALSGRIIPGIYNQNKSDFQLGYRLHTNRFVHMISTGILWEQAKGTEQYYHIVLIDTNTRLTNWQRLSAATKYYRTENQLSMLYQGVWRLNPKHKLQPHLQAGTSLFETRYHSTPYVQSADKWRIEGGLQWLYFTRASVWDTFLQISYSHCYNDQLIVPMQKRASQSQLIPDHHFLSASILSLQGHFQYQYSFISQMIGGGIKLGHSWSGYDRSWMMAITLNYII
jgi:hypothetical protein